MAIPDSKTCTKCGEARPLCDFYPQRDGALGVRGDCKFCIRELRKRERKANPELFKAREKARYAKFREKRKVKAREWYAKNTDKGKATRRAHYEANRDRYAAYTAKRKAFKRGVEREFYTRSEIYERDGGCCKLCGASLPFAPNGFEIDHIVPFDLGGTDTRANVQLACRPCNRKKWKNLEGQIHLPV